MHGGAERHGGRVVIVRRHCDRLGFGRGRNIHELENPTAIGDVGIEDVDGARARQQRLAGDDRNAARAANLGKGLDVLGLAGLLEPIGLELSERIGEIDGVHRREPPVHLDQDVDVRTNGVADRARHRNGASDVLLWNISPPRAGEGIELESGETTLDNALGGTRIILRLLQLVAPAVRIDAYTRTAGPAEEVVDRLLRDLADNVPQRLLDAGGGAVEFQRAAPLRVVVEGDLQDVPDLERVAADNVATQLLDLCGDGTVAVILAVGFAPTDHAGIGRNAHEHEILPPARIDRKTFDAGDFHSAPRAG